MGRLFLQINVTVDGYIEAPDAEIDWRFVDDEFEAFTNDTLRSIGGMIFGRVAHQKLAEYWPDAASRADISTRHREAIGLMNALPKYVVSRGPYETGWSNSHILIGDIADNVRRLKKQHAQDIALFAGASVARSAIGAGLIDEYRFIVNPMLQGAGKPLFAHGMSPIDLQLKNVRRFKSGALILSYTPAQCEAKTWRP